MYTIFYSWQSDLPGKFNRSYIENCLKKALVNINRSDDFIVELNLDRDTLGEPGTPDIVNTIFKKISSSDIFLCDISTINKDSMSKKTPNPNVLLELGYAAHSLGWENVICVYNSSFGNIEDLPFDLKFRRPVIYQYSDTEEKDRIALIKHLELAIKAADPEIAQQKKKIKRAFANEDPQIQKITIEQPANWEFRLSEALLISRLEQFNSKYSDLKKGVVFSKGQYLGPSNFLKFVENEMGNLQSTIEGLSILIKKDLMAAYGPSGISGNPIGILLTFEKIFNLLNNILEWEITIRSISTTRRLEEMRVLMLNMCENVVEEFNALPSQFKQIYTHPKSQEVHKITITIDSFGGQKALDLMEKYKSMPHLLLEE